MVVIQHLNNQILSPATGPLKVRFGKPAQHHNSPTEPGTLINLGVVCS